MSPSVIAPPTAITQDYLSDKRYEYQVSYNSPGLVPVSISSEVDRYVRRLNKIRVSCGATFQFAAYLRLQNGLSLLPTFAKMDAVGMLAVFEYELWVANDFIEIPACQLFTAVISWDRI